jgi:hypothetical protein
MVKVSMALGPNDPDYLIKLNGVEIGYALENDEGEIRLYAHPEHSALKLDEHSPLCLEPYGVVDVPDDNGEQQPAIG